MKRHPHCPDCGGPRGEHGPRCDACMAIVRWKLHRGRALETREPRRPESDVARHKTLPELEARYTPSESDRIDDGFAMLTLMEASE